MGLSRKLGGGTSTSSRAESHGHVQYTWSTQAYTMRDILTKFTLPCVVQCSGDAGSVLWADFQFDMRQPLLLHAARTVRKLHARSLQILEPSGDMEEFGPPLAIPEDYDGWFFPVGRNKDPTALPRHTRVEGVAGSSSRQFLVTTTLPAFAPAKGAGSGPKHVQHEVSIGEVLTKVGVMKGDPSVAPSSPSALMRQITRNSLRCLDENQHEIIIPFGHRALMFDVADNYGPPGANTQGPPIPGVVHTHTLISVGNRYLPRVFRHVLGELPALAQTFTGLMRCYSVFTEETVMAATMSRTSLYSLLQDSSCLELATDSAARFRIALNASELRKTHQYALALRTCEEQAPSYVRAIKTSFTVTPVVELEDVDMSLCDDGRHEERSEESPHQHGAPTAETSDCGPTSSVNATVHSENSSSDAVSFGKERGPTDTRDHDDVGGDDESVMTDDAPNSVVDTASLSEGTDMLCSDGVSDVGDEEANSEFDFAWGRLKRAKSFTGSISTLTDDSRTSSTPTDSDSESEDSTVDHGPLDSSVSQSSTLTKDASSSASGNTVVLRNSAPSPVYANVPKKLSMYNLEQNGEASCQMTGPPSDIVAPGSLERRSGDYQNVDGVRFDNSVRSVWNITPTVEAQHERGPNRTAIDSASPLMNSEDGRETADPIWWGDRSEHSQNNSNTASLDYRKRVSALEQSDSFTLEYPPTTAGGPTTDHHPRISQKSSTGSATDVQMSVAQHSLLSSKLSVRSEGSAQDLAIQRLERALNDATSFLSHHGPPPTAQPVAPPRRGKQGVSIHQAGSVYPGQDGDGKRSAPAPPPRGIAVNSDLPRRSATGSSLSALSASASTHSLSHHHARYQRDHRVQAKVGQEFGDGNNIQGNIAHCQSDPRLHSDQRDRRNIQGSFAHCQNDPRLASDQAPDCEPTYHESEAQIDLDFVKTLGDRLLAVSRKSSLPKYQRLQTDFATSVQYKSQDGDHQFKKKQRAGGCVPSSMEQDISCVEGGEFADFESANGGFSEDMDSWQRQAILFDLDFLEEEVV